MYLCWCGCTVSLRVAASRPASHHPQRARYCSTKTRATPRSFNFKVDPTFWTFENLREIAIKMAQENPVQFNAVVDALNGIAVAPEFTSIRDLMLNVNYEVRLAQRIATQYGSKVKLELLLPGGGGEAIFIVLPTRLARMSDEQLEGMNTMASAGCPLFFLYKGMKGPAFDVCFSST
ncbi:hypothetical protein FOCC_FOCC016499 [Frankliniella occidentalis]|nr:hypothetical protein FOCC_FOCC016499 [Frankliniella occidentalis]